MELDGDWLCLCRWGGGSTSFSKRAAAVTQNTPSTEPAPCQAAAQRERSESQRRPVKTPSERLRLF